jgi:hypothetical protein
MQASTLPRNTKMESHPQIPSSVLHVAIEKFTSISLGRAKQLEQ